MQLQGKLEKTAEITYLDANKKQTRYHLTYFEILKKKKGTIDILDAKEHHEKEMLRFQRL